MLRAAALHRGVPTPALAPVDALTRPCWAEAGPAAGLLTREALSARMLESADGGLGWPARSHPPEMVQVTPPQMWGWERSI